MVCRLKSGRRVVSADQVTSVKLPGGEAVRRPPDQGGRFATEPSHAVFLSYASQDAELAQRICEVLRAAGVEVWFDQSAASPNRDRHLLACDVTRHHAVSLS